VPQPKVTMIVPTLDSHEVLRRQILFWSSIFELDDKLREQVMIHVVDDNSMPPLHKLFWAMKDKIHFNFRVIPTGSNICWTQQLAMNLGVERAESEYVLMTAIDHIMPKEVFEAAVVYDGDKMHFPRKYAVLDAEGQLRREPEILYEYGAYPGEEEKYFGVQDIYLIRRWIYLELGGYQTKYYGQYGGDSDFHMRYGNLRREQIDRGDSKPIERHRVGPLMYAFPHAKEDKKRLFHKLPRNPKKMRELEQAIQEGRATKGGYKPENHPISDNREGASI